jgi:hypothetical protein
MMSKYLSETCWAILKIKKYCYLLHLVGVGFITLPTLKMHGQTQIKFPKSAAMYCCRNYPYAMADSSSLCDEGRYTTADDQTVTKPSTFRAKFSQVTGLKLFLLLLSNYSGCTSIRYMFFLSLFFPYFGIWCQTFCTRLGYPIFNSRLVQWYLG